MKSQQSTRRAVNNAVGTLASCVGLEGAPGHVFRTRTQGQSFVLSFVLLTASVGVSVGCGAKASDGGSSTVLPGEDLRAIDLRPEGRSEGDSAAELRTRYERYESELAEGKQNAISEPRSCRNLCEISANICETKAKLCKLADTQSGVAEYRNLCLRATHACHDAQASCLSCTQRFSPKSESQPATAVDSEPMSPAKPDGSASDE